MTRAHHSLLVLPAPTATTDYGLIRQERTSREGGDISLWTVSVKRQGRDVQRHFFDQVWGGQASSLVMARSYRDAVLRLIPPVTKRQAQTRLRRNNTTGVPGIFARRVKGQIVGWIATLETPGKRFAKTFMISTHGDQARDKAIAHRERLLQDHGIDTFVTLNARATADATQRFGDLLSDEGSAPAAGIDAAERAARLQHLNDWFDRQVPDLLYVRVRVYPGSRGSAVHIAHVRVLSTGSHSQVAAKGLSLGSQSYVERLPELWQFVRAKVTDWLGESRWQRFASAQETAFLSSTSDSGFQARDYSEPPDSARHRSPPELLLPWLAGFELPALDHLAPAPLPQPAAPSAVTPTTVAHPPPVSRNTSPGAAIMSPTANPPASRTPPRPQNPRAQEEEPMDRTFKAHSPLGDQLRFRSLAGREQISRLFEFRVNLLSESDAIGAKSLLGQDLSVEVDLTTEKNGGGKRFLSGQVVQFSFAGRDGDYFAYEAVLRPWLWLATRRSDFKIFQFKDVPTIVQEVLAPYGFTVINKLTGNYRAWDYCVQYGETDFNFISRLLETEGAYFVDADRKLTI